MNEIQTVRTAQTVGAEIRHITYQAKCMTLLYGVEIGRRLKEAKELVPYGGFGDFLKNETEFSAATASRFMKLFEEYGGALLEGTEDFPTLKKVSVSNALRLLALPAEEREDFAAEHDVEHLSARELDKLMAERDEALRRANEGAQVAEGAAMRMAELEECLDDARRREENSDREIAELKDKLSTAEQTAADTRRVLEDLAAENEELRNRPVDVAVEVDQEAIDKAAAEAKAAADAEWGKKLAKAEKDAEKQVKELSGKAAEADKLRERLAEEEERRAGVVAPYEEKIATLEKQLAMSGAEVTAFKLLFSDWQEAFNRMLEALQKVPEENREKLSGAVKSVLEGQVSRA